MFENYIFDLYGTLVDIHTNEGKSSLWRKMAYLYCFNGADYTPAELKREYLKLCREEEEKLSEKIHPELEITNVFRRLYLEKSVEADTELAVQTGKTFRLLSIEYIRLYDGVVQLLGELKEAGKKVYLLSNAQRIFTEPEMKMLKIYHCFDGILYSSDQGCKKPSPAFYQAILEKYQLKREESIMIGNDPVADIKGSHEAGLPSLYIHSNLSPELAGELLSDYTIMDGNVHRIKDMILR